MSFILTLLSALLLVYFPLPLKHARDNQVGTDVTVKQDQYDRWGIVPGDLGYKYTRKIKYSASASLDLADEPREVDLEMSRQFTNVDYVHTESILDYTQEYQYSGLDSTQMNKTMTSINFGAISAWHQINNRPEFLNGYRALVAMKKLYQQSDSYHRLFATNALYVAFNDENIVNQSVLRTVSAATQQAIMNDETYGFNNSETLYQWIRAMNGGADSQVYQDIVTHYQTGKSLADFTTTVMDQVVGDHSLLKMLNTTFTASVARARGPGYQSHLVDAAQFYQDQWGGRLITGDPSIPLYRVDAEHPSVQTVYDTFKTAAKKIPDAFSLPDYAPELNYYLSVVLSLSDEECSFTTPEIGTLFSDDITSPTTLLNPVNLQFFFENYHQGKFYAINKRFKEQNSPVLDDIKIHGIAKYIQFLIEKQVTQGSTGDSDYLQFTSYGSLLSAAMKKSYTQISTALRDWLPTRYFAAWADVNKKTCTTFLTPVITNATQVGEICSNFSFEALDRVQYFVLAQSDADWKAKLMQDTGITDDEFTKLYDVSDQTSLGYQLQQIQALIATTMGCASATQCTTDELTLMQYVSGKVTMNQPQELAGNKFLGAAEACLTDAWGAGVYNCPEIHNYAKEGTLTTAQAALLFDETSGNSLMDGQVAVELTKFILRNPSNDTNLALLKSLYQQDDFYAFYETLRSMIQGYLFGGAETQVTEYQHLFGYEDARIAHLFDEKAVQDGRELFLDSNVNIITNEQSSVVRNQTVGIYTGAIDKDQSSKVRFLNDVNYVNKKVNVFDGVGNHTLPVSPTVDLETIDNLYNGMQFAPLSNDTISYFDTKFMTTFHMKEDGDDSQFGKATSANPEIKIRTYKSTTDNAKVTLNSGFAFNQPLVQDITDHVMKINDEIGILIEHSYSQKQSLQVPMASMTTVMGAEKTEAKGIVLPLPQLDGKAGAVLPLTEVTETMIVNQQKYNDKFSYIHDAEKKIDVFSYIFLALMILFALVFIGFLTFFCVNLRKIKDMPDDIEDPVGAYIEQNH